MRVLFVYSLECGLLKNGLLDLQSRMQFGISYISSLLQKFGHHTNLVVLSKVSGQKNMRVLKDSIHTYDPNVICLSAVATEYDFIANIARSIKRHYPGIYVVGGGVHLTLNTKTAFLDDFDAVCVGEGEHPALELVQQLEQGRTPSGIPNLWIRHGSETEKNLPRKFIEDLDSLPFPDRILWQKWMNQKNPERCSILLSRGCPFRCSYCCNHALRKISPGVYVRYRTPKNIIEEMKAMVLSFPKVQEIYLETETITYNTDWCMELCSELEHFNATARRPLSYGANIRVIPNRDLEDLFSAFKKANFRFVNIGLESGSDRIRREVLNRNYSNEDIIRTVKLARKYGLKVSLFNLIGVPCETLADFKETVRMNRICKPDWHSSSIFFPYPGTDLYDLCREQGLLRKTLDPRQERKKATLDLPGFPRKKVEESYRFFDYYIRGLEPEDVLLIQFLRLGRALLDITYGTLIRIPLLKYALRPLKKYVKDRMEGAVPFLFFQ